MSQDSNTDDISVDVFGSADALFGDTLAEVTAIDIPIALSTDRPRACDREARSLLGPRRSSVFSPPVYAALNADTYEAACEANEAACGKRLSKQAFAILSRIREVNAVLRRSPRLAGMVREAHPEVSFYFWNGRIPMAHPKASGFGFIERHELVENTFGAVVHGIRAEIPRAAANDDDILDALAALWTARRIDDGTAIKLPSSTEFDGHGLVMQILA